MAMKVGAAVDCAVDVEPESVELVDDELVPEPVEVLDVELEPVEPELEVDDPDDVADEVELELELYASNSANETAPSPLVSKALTISEASYCAVA